jgi:hypothetical protein
MNTLSTLRNGKNALRQLRVLIRENLLTEREADRLLSVAEEAFAEVIPDLSPAGAAILDAQQVGGRGAFTVIDGGRP